MSVIMTSTRTGLHWCSVRRIEWSDLKSLPNSLKFFPNLRRRSLPLTCSLPDGTSSPTTTVSADNSLAVKKKATDVLPQLKGTSIFLVGMNNSVKTSLGKLLAETLRYYYFDSDNLVEEAAGGKSAKEIDEQGFRESETEVLKQLSSMGRLVVCAGNGAVRNSANLAFLRYGISIWIDVPLHMVAGESQVEPSVPEEEVLGQLASVFEESREGYATADATISLQKVMTQLGYDDQTAVTTEDMTLEVLNEIEKLTRVKKMMEAAATPF